MPKYSLELNIPLDNLDDISKKAEELKYNSLFLVNSSRNFYPDLWNTLHHISSITKNIGLGHAMTFLISNDPIAFSKLISTIDKHSSGRFELRLGLGGNTLKKEMQNLGLEFPSYDQRVRILDENLQIILNNLQKNSELFQKPNPPITISGKSRNVIQLALKYANVWEVGGFYCESYSDALELFHNELINSQNTKNIEKSVEIFVYVDHEKTHSKHELERKLDEKYGLIQNKWLFSCGSTDDIVFDFQNYIDLGVDRFTIYFLNNHSQSSQTPSSLLDQMETFSDSIIPNLSD